MDSLLDPYKKQKRIETLMRRIENNKDKLSQKNIKLLMDFKKYVEVEESLSSARVERLLVNLIKVAKWLKMDFNKAKKEDVMRVVQIIDNNDYSPNTVLTYKSIIRKFYKWLRGIPREEKIYPPEVSWIRYKANNSHKLPEELITREEIEKMINTCDNVRDRAFIRTLYESGCRIGEIATLKLKHVTFDQYGILIMVSGKTGQRRLRLIESEALLKSWIDLHPNKNDPESPLWVSQGTRNKGGEITYSGYLKIIKNCMGRAGIKKRIFPHLFRHSRATELANHLTDAQMKEFFGWTQGSKMNAIYIHLAGKNIDDSILQMYGLKKESNENFKAKIYVCPRCQEKNDISKTFCSKCGEGLTEEIRRDTLDAEKTELIETMEKMKKMTENYEGQLNAIRHFYNVLPNMDLKKLLETAKKLKAAGKYPLDVKGPEEVERYMG